MSNSKLLSNVASNLANSSGKILTVANGEIVWEKNYAWVKANGAFDVANIASSNTIVLQGVSATQNTRLTNIENVDATQNTNITLIQGVDNTQNTNISNITTWLNSNNTLQSGINTSQNTSISIIQGVDNTQNNRLTVIEGVDSTQNTNITNLTAWLNSNNTLQSGINTSQNTSISIIQGVDDAQNTSISNLTTWLNSNNSLQSGINTTQNTNITTANTWLQANDLTTLTASKNYTDTANTNLKSYVDAANTNNLIYTNNAISSNVNLIAGVDNTQNTNITNLTTWLNSNNTLQSGINTSQNTSITVIQGVDSTQNTNITNLTTWLNSNNTLQTGINTTQNTNITAIQGVDNTQNTSISSAFVRANSAYTKSNSAITLGTTPLYLGGTNTSISGLTLTDPVINGFTGNVGIINIGSGQIYKDVSGNFGIGTSSLSSLARLTVYSTDTPSSSEYTLWLKGGSAGVGNDGGGIAFSVAGTSAIANPSLSATAIRSLNSYASESNGEQGDLAFYTNQRTGTNTYTGLTERLRITSSGNVRMGDTSAVDAAGRYFDVYNLGNNAASFAIIRLITQQVASSASTSVDFFKNKAGGFIINNNETNSAAYTAFGVGGLERLRITSAGNVGIGTPSPDVKVVIHTPSAGLTAGNIQEVFRLGDRGSSASDSLRVYLVRDTTAGSAGEWFSQSIRLERNIDGVAPQAGIDFSPSILKFRAGGAQKGFIDTSKFVLNQNSNAANNSVSFDTTIQNALTLDASGNLQVFGGVTLGTGNVSIKVKKITGTLSSSTNTLTAYAHGIGNRFKILSVSARADITAAGQVFFAHQNLDSYDNGGAYYFRLDYIDNSNIALVTGSNSEFVLGKPVTITIIYEA